MNIKKILRCLLLFLLLFLLFFYRKPHLTLRPKEYNILRSPAFGKVIAIEKEDQHLVISIFLSPLDIHYQVSPANGIVRDVQYTNTRCFNPAYDEKKSKLNEKSSISIDTVHGTIVVRQMVGSWVRRIDTYVKPIQRVKSGELIGFIRFGSHVELVIPMSSSFRLLVQEGDDLRGSDSVIGHYI